MATSEEFKKALEANNVRLVRIMMKDSLMVDPTFEEFDEMQREAESRLPGLYEPHDGEELNMEPSDWNKDYMDEQMVKALRNFSRERLKLLKDICRRHYADRAEEIRKERATQTRRTTQAQPADKSTPRRSAPEIERSQSLFGPTLLAIGAVGIVAVLIIALLCRK